MSLRFLTAGESHGASLTGILEGVPAGLELSQAHMDRDLGRRQRGYGRSGRQRIEKDHVEIRGGVRGGRTTGAPIALVLENKDAASWRAQMSVEPFADPPARVTRPRPGHADLAGALKYGHADLRDVIERASARETAMRVAIGAVARRLLDVVGVEVLAYVISIGEVRCAPAAEGGAAALEAMRRASADEEMRALDPASTEAMKKAILDASHRGDTVGGVFEVVALGVPVGLGSYVHWDRRLDGRIAQALMSIPGIKGVELGGGVALAGSSGAAVHDSIVVGESGGVARNSNRAGGIEGGISNGEPVIARAAMKPLPTLRAALPSVDLGTGEAAEAFHERSDICAVPAASVVGEAMVAFVLAQALLEKVGGDSMAEIEARMPRLRGQARGAPT